MTKKIARYAVISLISLISFSSTAADLEKSRQQYLRADNHMRQGKYEAAQKEMPGLETYPLYPYLAYKNLRYQLVRADKTQVQAFLDRYSATWFGQDIRNEWLRILAKRQNWPEYLAFYQQPVTSVDLSCHYWYAVSQVTPDALKNEAIEPLWYRGKSLPASCDPIITLWQEQGGMTPEAVLTRTKLALKSGNLELTKELANSLPEVQKEQLAHWFATPPDVLIGEVHDMDAPLTDDILFRSLQQLVDSDLENGMAAWQKLSQCYTLNEQNEGEVVSNIAVKLAVRHDPRAAEWLDQVPDDHTTKAAREWRVRDAIWRENWQDILKWTSLLPADERKQDVWLYWRARAWDHLDTPHKAHHLYLQTAQTRSYYGFLAAQRLDRKLPLNHKTIPISDLTLQEVAHLPGIERAKELYLLGQLDNARREWEFTVAQLPAAQQMAAAKLAHGWAWHDRALITANKTDLIDDLDIRFPIPHKETVVLESQKRELNPALVFSIIRQESAFMPDARSPFAIGLMQVRPESASDFAKRVWKEPAPSDTQLFTPEYNIRVGSAYFNGLLKELNGQIVPAIASYNAGAGRVKKWLPKEHPIPMDEWVETVPYYETREYVQHVLAYFVIYTHHLHQENSPESTSIEPLFSAITPLTLAEKIHHE